MGSSGHARSYQTELTLIIKALDLILVWLSLFVAGEFYGLQWSLEYNLVALSGVIVFYISSRELGIYQYWRAQNTRSELGSLVKCWLCIMFAFLLLTFAIKLSGFYSRLVLVSWWIFGCTFQLAARVVLSKFGQPTQSLRSAVIIGHGQTALQFAENIRQEAWSGIKIKGYFDVFAAEHNPANAHLPYLGNLELFLSQSREAPYDVVFVTQSIHDQSKVEKIIGALRDSASEVHVIPEISGFKLINSRIRDFAGVPVVSVYDSPLDGFGRMVKRCEDIALSMLFILVTAIPMLLIALAVKLDSPGPVLFKQSRSGKSGRKIEIWKFRTMHVCENDAAVKQATRYDPRITRLGAFLRRTSLDELPQFFNVLKGSMSIVGPRPHALTHNEEYRSQIEGYMQRHLVKPGITGWAQVNGWRGETDTPTKMKKRVEHDMHYIRSWSLWLDIKIVVMTVFRSFTDKNAY